MLARSSAHARRWSSSPTSITRGRTPSCPGPAVPRIKLGQAATVRTDAGQTLQGTVTFVSSRAEFTPRNVQTAEERSRLVYRVKVTVDNSGGILKQGMPVDVDLVLP